MSEETPEQEAVEPVRGILDTSTVILLQRLEDAMLLPSEPLITAVTLAELSVGPLVTDDETERVARQAHLQQAEADFDPLPFDAAAARAFGRVAASLRRSGRKPSARAYDAMIAATAVANDLPVYTCNPTDFLGIDGLEVVAIPVPTRDPGSRAAQPSSLRSHAGHSGRLAGSSAHRPGSVSMKPVEG